MIKIYKGLANGLRWKIDEIHDGDTVQHIIDFLNTEKKKRLKSLRKVDCSGRSTHQHQFLFVIKPLALQHGPYFLLSSIDRKISNTQKHSVVEMRVSSANAAAVLMIPHAQLTC